MDAVQDNFDRKLRELKVRIDLVEETKASKSDQLATLHYRKMNEMTQLTGKINSLLNMSVKVLESALNKR